MVFGSFLELDTNFNRDIASEDMKGSCPWFTIFLGTTIRVDEDGDERTHYEYVAFPSTLTNEKHIISISTPIPYYPGQVVAI